MTPDTTNSKNFGAVAPQIQSTKQNQPQQSPNVLLVEDDPVMVKLLTYALEKRGFNVRTATDGKKAVECLQNSEEPSVVLLDLMLPYVNGYEVLNVIRSNDVWKNIPVIVMTAESKRQCVNEAFNAGANDYLVKPIRFDDLIIRVKSFTGFH